ncbi:putative Late nodulin [Medicago truncatula]|uniref:Putative Late nodulin n=1 Tax=Medicago truncatula TaxID=3880 RepID=I3SEA7_MEDTR|nr:unknown [Medicago truncatula]RHN48524.1 putative Late nodulin [Medicago truncatula]
MAEIFKFFYALIIFISLILSVANADPMYCFNDDDCRELKCSHPRVRKCRMFLCRCEEVDKEDEK